MEAYCLKCKEKREMLAPTASFTVNGRAITKGTCAVCGGVMSKLGMTDAHAGLEKPVVQSAPKKETRKPAKKVGAEKSASKKNRAGGKAAVAGSRAQGKNLVIVESPAKSRTIGKYLGDKYLVVASVGHIRDLLKSQLSVDVENNFTPKYRVPNEKKALVREITNLADQSDKVYLATDPDREGEAIAWHLMDTMGISPERTERVVFHEITKDAISEAFAHPREIAMDLVNAQQARRILDRLVGYGVSPILWAKVRGGLTAGRVQSVALRLIVEREREIEAFVPVEYWLISAEFTPDGSTKHYHAKLVRINQAEPILPDEATTLGVVEDLRQASYQLDSLKTTQKNVYPKAPHITSTLQQDASQRLGFPSRKTMLIAQQLYEGIDIGNGGETGLITYMRTDSVHVAPQAVQEARSLILRKYGEVFLPEKPPIYKTRAASAQEAHEAIRPTSVLREPASIKDHLTADQFKLYTLIWQRFLASQMSPALLEIITAEISGKSAANTYLLRASHTRTLFKGYQVLFQEAPGEDEQDEEEDGELPIAVLHEGQTQHLEDLEYSQHFTQPPPRFTEASLIKVLEENKIGRPSTYSPIISTILARGYVTTEKKSLIPTETGFLVNDLVVEFFPSIVDIRFTSEMEDELDKIADGKQGWVDVIREFYQPFEASLKFAQENMPEKRIEPEKLGRACPQCGSELVLRNGRFGKFVSCSAYPNCKYTENHLERIGVVCPTCKEGDVVRKRTRKGRVFYGCSRYPDCDFTSWDEPLKQSCPQCGGVLVAKNKHFARCLACSEVFTLESLKSEPD
ncbi:MAG TPA: type I DNA topoisomerase [Anaerolineaceae bacterium]|nr:type I DNA topoisomerase [Anaerolineaceae bacterium]